MILCQINNNRHGQLSNVYISADSGSHTIVISYGGWHIYQSPEHGLSIQGNIYTNSMNEYDNENTIY